MPRITPPPDLDLATAHGIYRATLAIESVLDEASELNAVFMSTREKEAVLLELPSLMARLAELNYRVMACADDVADAHGARNVGDYIAHATRQSAGTASRDLKTARELDTRWLILQAALRDGRVNVAQSLEITKALNELPSDLEASVLSDAERVLVDYAEKLTPQELRRAGKRIIDVVAPEISEALEGERLADLERAARDRQKLTLKAQGDGTTRISGLLTDLCANRLATALNAITNPRRDHLAPNRAPEVEPVETSHPTKLSTPRDAWHDKISAGEARRLACNTGILPAILNGESHVLDLGRTQRFFSAAQNRALGIRHPYCAADGCRIPVTWCETHHWDPWSLGGRTDLNKAVPLCSKHHHYIHDPLYLIQRLAHGAIRFTRRR